MFVAFFHVCLIQFALAVAVPSRLLIVGSGANTPYGAVQIWKFDGSSLIEVSQWRDGTTNFSPSWLFKSGSTLYSGAASSGRIYALNVDNSYQLTLKQNVTALNPVNFEIHAQNLVSTSYTQAGLNSYIVSPSGLLAHNYNVTYTGPLGPNTARQNIPHLHQAHFHPAGNTLYVPDLGSDYIRIFSSSHPPVSLQNITVTPAGCGPRHGAFWPYGSKHPTRFYLLCEMANLVITYKLFPNCTLDPTPIQELSTFGSRTVPTASPVPTAGEVQISPDSRFLYASNRGDADWIAQTGEDSIAQYAIHPNSGLLTFVRHSGSGGIMPRHFAIDKAGGGKLVSVANTNIVPANGTVAVLQREAQSGYLSPAVVVKQAVGGGYFAGFLDRNGDCCQPVA